MADPPARRADRPPARWKRWGCLLAVAGLVAVAFVPIRTTRWSGGFDQAEYRFTFTDAAGRPVPGVALRVLTRAGRPSYLYPVDEFLPDLTPTSDADGRMVFHHAGSGPEYGGTDRGSLLSLLDIWYTRAGAPEYVCVFALDGQEFARLPYRDLRVPYDEYRHLPKVVRTWRHTDWPFREYVAHHDDWEAHRLRLFDGDGNGRLDREEYTALVYFHRLAEPPQGGWPEREVEFVVVEQTVVVPGR